MLSPLLAVVDRSVGEDVGAMVSSILWPMVAMFAIGVSAVVAILYLMYKYETRSSAPPAAEDEPKAG